MTLGRPASVVATLRTDDLAHLVLHDLVHDREPRRSGERQQALLGHSCDLAQPHLDLLGQRHGLSGHLTRRCDLDSRSFLPTAVPPVS